MMHETEERAVGGDQSGGLGMPSASRRQASQARAGSSSSATTETRQQPPTSSSPRGQIQHAQSSSGLTSLIGKIILLFTIILRILLWPVRRTFNFLFPLKEFDGVALPGVADRAARAFVTKFTKAYLTPPPHNRTQRQDGAPPPQTPVAECPFVTTGYTSTLHSIADLAPASPLLLVYLHSPLHRDADSFAAKTLADDRTLAYAASEDMLRCYGASIHTADGAHVANSLSATSYPFVAVLSCKGSPSRGGDSSRGGGSQPTLTVEILLKMEGEALTKLRPEQFVGYVSTTVRRYRAVMAEAEARRLQREEESRLRQEQDREFQEALLADQRREAERLEAERLAQEETRRREEESRLAEEKARRKIDDARALVPPEPAPGSPGTARIRLTLPTGARIDRRFMAANTVDMMRAFLVVHFHDNNIDITNFSMSSNYPKRTYDEGSLTLEEAGLCPQAVIMIQDLDA